MPYSTRVRNPVCARRSLETLGVSVVCMTGSQKRHTGRVRFGDSTRLVGGDELEARFIGVGSLPEHRSYPFVGFAVAFCLSAVSLSCGISSRAVSLDNGNNHFPGSRGILGECKRHFRSAQYRETPRRFHEKPPNVLHTATLSKAGRPARP